jgi:hypothetical protein
MSIELRLFLDLIDNHDDLGLFYTFSSSIEDL